MGSITTRHIRHDWPEWIDWHTQKSVKTMCGVRSRPGLCGIPGVTEQSSVVVKNGREVWGWCMRCVIATWPYILPPALTIYVTRPEIIDLHRNLKETIKPQYVTHLEHQYSMAVKDGRRNSAAVLRNEIEQFMR